MEAILAIFGGAIGEVVTAAELSIGELVGPAVNSLLNEAVSYLGLGQKSERTGDEFRADLSRARTSYETAAKMIYKRSVDEGIPVDAVTFTPGEPGYSSVKPLMTYLENNPDISSAMLMPPISNYDTEAHREEDISITQTGQIIVDNRAEMHTHDQFTNVCGCGNSNQYDRTLLVIPAAGQSATSVVNRHGTFPEGRVLFTGNSTAYSPFVFSVDSLKACSLEIAIFPLIDGLAAIYSGTKTSLTTGVTVGFTMTVYRNGTPISTRSQNVNNDGEANFNNIPLSVGDRCMISMTIPSSLTSSQVVGYRLLIASSKKDEASDLFTLLNAGNIKLIELLDHYARHYKSAFAAKIRQETGLLDNYVSESTLPAVVNLLSSNINAPAMTAELRNALAPLEVRRALLVWLAEFGDIPE